MGWVVCLMEMRRDLVRKAEEGGQEVYRQDNSASVEMTLGFVGVVHADKNLTEQASGYKTAALGI
jgi:hypothetical protein